MKCLLCHRPTSPNSSITFHVDDAGRLHVSRVFGDHWDIVLLSRRVGRPARVLPPTPKKCGCVVCIMARAAFANLPMFDVLDRATLRTHCEALSDVPLKRPN